jgi:putative DNA modification/repair radical SAM protein
MELLLETVVRLRKLYNFNGYIHLKGIPGADPKLIMRAGEFVDRMSFNLELPTEKSLRLLAPQKNKKNILSPITLLRDEKIERTHFRNKFLQAGQTTQIIVGASPEKDGQILNLTQALYGKYHLKRVYYSSFVPVVQSSLLPTVPTGLLREHRLYQADWLIRFYGFKVSELISENENLSTEYDPKCAWALKHPELFPVDVNTAPLEMLIRIPGIGVKSAYKIISARRYGRLSYEDFLKMKISIKRAIHFITFSGKFFGSIKENTIESALKINTDTECYEQLSMFSTPQIYTSVIQGEL